ncbi:hypothetical protein JOD54_002181 [Actinokineospora baliensis]|nr:hypothetical protein [Actinokineospora baliensis]MBM7771977.1 hypothetical protein [Actinokineospora baliensis]
MSGTGHDVEPWDPSASEVVPVSELDTPSGRVDKRHERVGLTSTLYLDPGFTPVPVAVESRFGFNADAGGGVVNRIHHARQVSYNIVDVPG